MTPEQEQPQTQMQSTELIDATQNAVIGVVNSISEMIETPSKPVHIKTHEPFYLSAEFWVGMAFILTVLILCRPLVRILKKMLILRREKIISRINEASQLRDDAQVLLAKYERMAQSADDEIQKMTAQALEDINNYQEESLRLLQISLDKRRQEADRIMQGSLESALFEMTNIITKRSLEIVYSTLQQKLTSKQKQKFASLSVQNLIERLKN